MAAGALQANGQVDCYTVSAAAGDQLRIRIVKTSGMVGLEKRVLRPDGTEVCGSNMARESTCPLDTTGVQQILVHDAYSSPPGRYSITVQRLNDPVGCSVIPYGQTVSNDLAVAAQVDCWLFSGASGEVVRIKTQGTYGAVNAETELIRSDGTIECAYATTFERTCTLDSTGTHILLGKDNPGTNTGKFNLTLECDTPPCAPSHGADFDGDGASDASIFRNTTGSWFVKATTGSDMYVSWGATDDIPVAADYDGDGKVDIAVYRPSTGQWFVINSAGGNVFRQFGAVGDVPAPADYDGDGKADIAVYRPATGQWFVLGSAGGSIVRQWGTTGDVPVAADYDGDGKADIAVYRPATGQWFIIGSGGATVVRQWGATGDLPVAADYDGDGKADIAVYRPGTGQWFIIGSARGSITRQWGASGDMPVVADYDRDGAADVAVYRPSTGQWLVARSAGGTTVQQWGALGDTPVVAPR